MAVPLCVSTVKPGLAFSTVPSHPVGGRLHDVQETLQQEFNKVFNEHLPCHPSTFLENSTTANCIPKHTPCRGREDTSAIEKAAPTCPTSLPWTPCPACPQNDNHKLSYLPPGPLPTSTLCCFSCYQLSKTGSKLSKTSHMKIPGFRSYSNFRNKQYSVHT